MPRRRRSNQNIISEMNVVPYIDVMLVLLIIFMVTAPMMTQGIKIDLPKASSEQVEISEDNLPIVIAINKEGNYYNETTSESSLTTKSALIMFIMNKKKENPNVNILIKADENVSYGKVVKLMSLMKKNNISNFGLITEDE